MRRIASLALLILASAFSAGAQAPSAASKAAAGTTKHSATAVPRHDLASAAAPHTSATYGNVPLSFEQNRGQTDAQVKYLARGKGYTIFLTPTKEVLDLRQAIPSPQDSDPLVNPKAPSRYSQTVLEFDLAGANEAARISGTDLQPGISNYYIGNDPTKWRAGIPNYGRVLYRNAYPGIDITYYGHQGQLESDFILAPGADPGTIRMRVQGAKDLQIAATGDLVLSLGVGSVKLQQPVAYQIIGGARREIHSGYKLLAANEVGITLGLYDHRRKLIIDPTLAYSTYLGGSGFEGVGDAANTVVVDAAGEAYVTGYTNSPDFPTQNAEQGSLGAGSGDVENAFVTKFAASGTSLVFSTYLGGSAIDGGNGIAIDSAGGAYVTGSTNSTNFPTLHPLTSQDTFIGGRCAFVSAFSSAGALTFSTYLCGGVNDYADGIAVDSSKDIYVTGITASANFPTVNPIQASLPGMGNPFVSKLAAVSANGSSLLFSTFFGGNARDFSQAIALDSSSPPNIYIGGNTTSTVFPTKNAVQTTNNTRAGGATGFVAEMTVPAGVAPSVVYATFLGGSVADDVNGIAVDSAGNTYVTGVTNSPDFPLKNSLQAFDAEGDVFVAKIAAGGGTLDFSTYFGGSAHSSGSAIALDASDNIYITGTTSAADFPTRLPLQATLNNVYGGATPFVSEFKADGSDYIFSTYLGGSYSTTDGTNYSNGIAVDSGGNVYVVGQSVDFDYPTVNPVQATLKAASGNAFVAKIEPATPTGAQVYPTALNFGSVVTGTRSPAQVVTLANGSNALDISSIVVSGTNAADFNSFSTCGQTVPATVVCTFTVTFTPSTSGAESATVTINESSGTQSFTLSGTGGTTTGPTPGTISLTPATLTFLSQEVDTTSTPQLLTVMVTSTNPVTLTGFTTTGTDYGDFRVAEGTTTPCAFDVPLASGTNCKIGVVFEPSAVGARSATIQIEGTFTGSPDSVSVSGTGTPQIANLAPTSLTFPNTVVGTTSSAMTATLTNLSGTVALMGINPTVTSFPTGSFAISANTCPAATGPGLGPGLSCTISITFTPTSAGIAGGELMVADSDGTSPQTLFLGGTGLNASATLATISPNFIAFGRQTAATTSYPRYVFLQNIGNTALTFTNPLSGTNPSVFAATNSCSGTIAAAGTCEVSVTFTPTGTGPFFATLTINSSAIGAPQAVQLSGTGTPASTVSLLPNPLVFPAITVGQTSAPEYAYLNNTGTTADALVGIPFVTITGTDFEDFQLSLTGPGNTPCSQNQLLNAQAVCVIGVVFMPSTTGLRTATLQVTDTATGTPHSITLQGGTGVAPLQITTTSPLPGGTVGAAYSTTLAASGGTAPYAWSFTTGNLPPGLSVGATGIIGGTPTTAGTFTFSVQATDSTSPTPQSATATFTLTVSASSSGGLTILTTSLPNGEVTLPYGAGIAVSGGTPPYSFAVTAGTITSGLTLNSTTGLISGFPSCCTPATFTITVTDSASNKASQAYTITVLTAPSGGNSLLNGYYTLLFRSFNETTKQEDVILGNVNFDSTGDFSGEVDYYLNGATGQAASVGGFYVVGPDNRGIMNFQLPSGTFQFFTIAVGNVYRGVAQSVAITNFSDNTGTGNIGSGEMKLATLESNYLTTFPGTYVFGLSGQDTALGREAQAGLISFAVTDGANTVASGTADVNDAGTISTITSIGGTFATPDEFGRTVLNLTQTPGGTAQRVVYIRSPQEFEWGTVSPSASNPLLVGTALRQTATSFNTSSIVGPDAFTLRGLSTSGNGYDDVVGVATAASGAISVTFDENDGGTVVTNKTLNGVLTVGSNGRASAPLGSQTWVAYLATTDTGFSIGTGAGAVAGELIPQVGTPFATNPLKGNFIFGSAEALGPFGQQDSGVADITGSTYDLTEDISHAGGLLYYGAALGTVNFAVSPSGRFTTVATATSGALTGYLVSPYELLTFEQSGTTTSPAASAHAQFTIALSTTAPPGTPSPASPTVNFPTPVEPGSSATSALVTITNTGLGPLGFTGVNTANSPDFSASGGCVPIGNGAVVVVQPLSSCTFTVTFAPPMGASGGAVSQTLILTTDGTSSVTVTATGTVTGAPATVTVAPTSLTFASQSLNSTSPAQDVTVTNTGTGPVTFTSFSVTGSGSGDFALAGGAGTGACNPTGVLAAGSSCTIGVTFTPTAVGAFTATLSIADNATGSPQLVALNGTGNNSPVTISIPPGGSTTGTATPGGTAYFGLEISGASGVTGTVQLGCTPSSPTITCTVIPSSIVLTGKPVEVAFGIQTYCQGATGAGFLPGMPGSGPWGGIGLLLLSLGLGGLAWAMQRNRRVALTFAVLMLVAMGTEACGSLAKGPNGATPPGTYKLTLTTTINGQTQTMTNFLTLVVQ